MVADEKYGCPTGIQTDKATPVSRTEQNSATLVQLVIAEVDTASVGVPDDYFVRARVKQRTRGGIGLACGLKACKTVIFRIRQTDAGGSNRAGDTLTIDGDVVFPGIGKLLI